MKNLDDAPGIDKTTTGYLNGKIKDNETLIGELINNDIVQFFQKMMEIAGLAPNDLYDNEDNGYQLIDALRATIELIEDWTEAIPVVGWSNTGVDGAGLFYFKNNSGIVHIKAVGMKFNAAITGAKILWDSIPAEYQFGDGQFMQVITSDAGVGSKEVHNAIISGNVLSIDNTPGALPANTPLYFYLIYRNG